MTTAQFNGGGGFKLRFDQLTKKMF